jgi:hypothetical protein
MNKKEIAKFVQESVEWLVKNQEGCCRYQLDDHLAIFVGWSAGYGDEERDDILQAKDDPDWGINAGIKVWTSDYMQTDYDWLNFPYYKDGDVLDMGWDIKPNEDYERVAEYLLKMYHDVCHLKLADDGLILRDKMWVCEHCLMAIESREGNQATLRHSVDEDDDVESECDWCHECGFDTLYELV